MNTPLHVISVNQDSGIDSRRKKGAAVHLEAMRDAFRQLGLAVSAIDEPKPDRVQNELERLTREHPADLVYERYALGRSAAARFACESGLPYAIEVNSPLADEQARWRGKIESETDRKEDAATFGAAGFVAAVSSQVAEYAMARGASAEAVFVCPNGVDTKRFRPGRQSPPASLPDDAFVLGFHGRERPWHGFEMLAEAVRQLQEQSVPVHLLVVGEGDFAALKKLPDGSFTRVPWVEHERVPALIGNFDVLPLTYAPDAPFYFSPLKLAEAMACGAVPVVPELGDLPTVVEHGRNGVVYPAGDLDALVDLLRSLAADPARRAALSTAAARSASDWGWDHIARRILDHFGLGVGGTTRRST